MRNSFKMHNIFISSLSQGDFWWGKRVLSVQFSCFWCAWFICSHTLSSSSRLQCFQLNLANFAPKSWTLRVCFKRLIYFGIGHELVWKRRRKEAARVVHISDHEKGRLWRDCAGLRSWEPEFRAASQVRTSTSTNSDRRTSWCRSQRFREHENLHCDTGHKWY